MTDTDNIRVTKEEVRDFIVRCGKTAGASQDHADRLADNLVCADYRGHFTHGLNRTTSYVNDLRNGTIAVDGEPVILKETPCSAWVDGRNILGVSSATFCMDLAIKKAKEVGIGWVCAKGCNHFGIAGYYTLMAQEAGLVGMAMTNTSPVLLPTRSRDAALGTNPISVAAPANNGDSFVLDMSTSATCFGKIEMAEIKSLPIPNVWGCDQQGKVSDNPTTVLEGRRLLPLGGTEITSGYKGYGLAMMVEVFCGMMSGSLFGPQITTWSYRIIKDKEANLGQCFVAIDPNVFAPGFEERMSSLLNMCRNLKPAEGETEVVVAGDLARQAMKRCDEHGGMTYHSTVIARMDKLADDLGIPRMKTVKVRQNNEAL